LANAIVSMPKQWDEDLISLHGECCDYVAGRRKWKGRPRLYNEILGSKVSGGRIKWVVFFWVMVTITIFLLNRYLNDALVNLLP